MEKNSDDEFDLPMTNCFSYKGEIFPFNLSLFNCYSNYFKTKKINPDQIIDLVEELNEDLELTKDSISYFVDHCQRNKKELKKEIIPSLYKLSKKFMVPTLLKSIQNYVSKNNDDFSIQILLMNKDNPNDIEVQHYEDIIAEHLENYITNDQLLSLSFPVLYRILTKYQLENPYQNLNTKYLDFLFNCIDKYGKIASTLFVNIDFSKEQATYLHRLLSDEYSGKFDFHFINHAYHKTIYDLQNEIIQKEENIKLQQIEMSNIKEQQNLLNVQIEQLKAHQEEELKKIREENDMKICQIIDNFQKQIESLNCQIKEMKKPRIQCHFAGDSTFKGITSFLGNSNVMISAGGVHNKDHPLSNILDYNDLFFYNYWGTTEFVNFSLLKSENESWIEFDFGPSRKIDLFSYFIRSNNSNPSTYYHAKSWRILGSNDHKNWNLLERRVNDNSLNGNHFQNHFHCQESKYGDPDNRYRYIKYIQEDSWCEHKDLPPNPFNIYITYFELFGDIFIE